MKVTDKATHGPKGIPTINPTASPVLVATEELTGDSAPEPTLVMEELLFNDVFTRSLNEEDDRPFCIAKTERFFLAF